MFVKNSIQSHFLKYLSRKLPISSDFYELKKKPNFSIEKLSESKINRSLA